MFYNTLCMNSESLAAYIETMTSTAHPSTRPFLALPAEIRL